MYFAHSAESQPPKSPYHLFALRGKHFLFHIESNTAFRLDEVTYKTFGEILTRYHSGEDVPDILASVLSNTPASVAKDIALLDSVGFFENSAKAATSEEVETYINQHLQLESPAICLFLAECCNSRCRYCYVQHNGALDNGLMPWTIARQAVDLLFARSPNSKSVEILFFGGEPLLNKSVMNQVIDYGDSLAAQKKKQIKFGITTNATLLDKETVDIIHRHRFSVKVSLDGPPEIHDYQRPLIEGKSSFAVAIPNIRTLAKARGGVQLRATLTSETIHKRLEVLHFLQGLELGGVEIGYSDGRVGNIGPLDLGEQDFETMRRQDERILDGIIDDLRSGKPVRYNPWWKAVALLHRAVDRFNQGKWMRCGVGRGCTTVGIDGRLYPCHRYVGLDNHVLGTVQDGIDEQRYAEYIRRYFGTKERCQNCWLVNLCGGYCPWQVSKDDGRFSNPVDYWCDNLRTWQETGIWFYDLIKTEYPAYLKSIVGTSQSRREENNGL